MGHRNIKNPLIYIQLEEALFKGEIDQCICKVAETRDVAKELRELGFDHAYDRKAPRC